MRPADNPFNTHIIESIPFVFMDKTTSKETVMKKIETLNFKGAFCGPKGSGKTLLMDEIQVELEKKGFKVKKEILYFEDTFFVKLKKCLRLIKRLSLDDAVFLDGAEQLSYPVWIIVKWLISKQAGAFLISTHKPGRMPLVYQTHTSEKLLKSLFSNYPVQTRTDLKSLDTKKILHEKNGNIREVFMSLYDMECGRQTNGLISD